MRAIGLEYLSVFGMHPAEYVELAARVGFSCVGLNLTGAPNRLGSLPSYDLRTDAGVRRATRQRLRDAGVRLSVMEGFPITPGSDVSAMGPWLDWSAEMGARAICAVSVERDRNRSHDQFAQLTRQASQRGLTTTTEVGAGILKNLDRALEMVSRVDDSNFALLIDTMHFFRSGASLQEFAALKPGLVTHVQLCDVPMPAVMSDYMQEALYERRAPGDGDLPLRELAPLLPQCATIGLEIPARSQIADGANLERFLTQCLLKAQSIMQ